MFNITNIENIENAKYSTKNNKIYDKDVFLATINHTRAIISSSRNLRVIAASVYTGWLVVSLVCPLKNIIKTIPDTIESEKARQTISTVLMFIWVIVFIKMAVPISAKTKDKSKKRYFTAIFTAIYHLIKSFTAIYIAVKTPRRDSIIVKTGVLRRKSLSSFMPPHTVSRIITIICTPSPEYLA